MKKSVNRQAQTQSNQVSQSTRGNCFRELRESEECSSDLNSEQWKIKGEERGKNLYTVWVGGGLNIVRLLRKEVLLMSRFHYFLGVKGSCSGQQ